MNIPKTLQEFGVKEDEFKEKLSSIAELAVGDACTGSNPRSITPEQMEKLFACIPTVRSRFLMKKLFVLQKAHRKMCFLKYKNPMVNAIGFCQLLIAAFNSSTLSSFSQHA